MRIVVSLVVILSAFFVLSCGGGDTSAPASTPAPQPTSAPTQSPTPASTPAPQSTSDTTQPLTPVSTPAPQPTPPPTQPSTPDPTPIPPPPEPINISGTGTVVESISLLSEGIWIVAIEVNDNEDCSLGSCSEDNFIVTIESVDGSSTEFPANEIAKDWSAEVTVSVGGLFGLPVGKQVVSVDASGDWTISFNLALPLASPADPDAPVSIAGSGTAVESISLSEGLWIVALDVSDNEDCSLGFCSEDNFIVTIESIDGSNFEIPANEIASAWSGEVTVSVGGLFGLTVGTQVVSVDASGDWTITFTKA